MPKTISNKPRNIPQIMVSSTFTDLQEHRGALIDAIHAHKLHANVMENDSARLVDVIDSSLQMVSDSAAYIGVISLKYGQTPECPTRNPDQLSITELEFNEAQRLGRPILLFIMGDKHPVTKADIERDSEKEKKLDAFRVRAKKASGDSKVNRVYAVFNSLEEFKDKLGSSLNELGRHLDSVEETDDSENSKPADAAARIPKPPAFYAEPDYIGSHKFIGRAAELQVLTDWAAPADSTNLLLFEAIGGNGKSMLTWEWTTNPRHALAARPADKPWAGRFWYSFYERGAIMADFCQRALAYMTERPLEDFAKKKTAELKDELLAQLHARPWLLILDGLERVLVAYHRIDAAEVPDEEANIPTDKIVNRNPCDAIHDEDNDLLRALAAARPSKLLVSSRLTPRVLLNPSGQPIPGAKRVTLPGLRPPDAEALLRSCGIEGKSDAIQSYLTANCDNHPLVIGILGGLIANYLPARGDFDAWSAALDGGAALDLASLDLIQRRNHILEAAIQKLPDASRQLLSTLALLTDSVDYETLKAFNPHLPPEPEEVEKPTSPEEHWRWSQMSDEQRAERQKQYEVALARRQDYEKAVQTRLASAEFRAAPKKLEATVKDLEQRSLLQWDGRTRKYDLHPVVRGVASGAMAASDRERHGQRVVDHFAAQPHRPYEEAETLEDVRSGLYAVRTLLKLGHYQQAADAYRGDLANALTFNLNAHAETLALLKPFFPHGWDELPKKVEASDSSYLATCAAGALHYCGELAAALVAHGAGLRNELEAEDWLETATRLQNISLNLTAQNRLAQALRTNSLALEVATLSEHEQNVFGSRLDLFTHQSRLGQWAEAAATWSLLDPMGRAWSRAFYRPGKAETLYAELHFEQGSLQEEHLAEAERLAAQGKDRTLIRELHRLRGDWRLTQGEWALAAASYQEAVRLARDTRSVIDAASETGLALAKHHLCQLAYPREEAERLAQLRNPAHRLLAQLWLALGDPGQAKHHALAAYKDAWADGEPYVHRYELTQTTKLLQQLNVPIPNLPPYDSAKDDPLRWEAEVNAAIRHLRLSTSGAPSITLLANHWVDYLEGARGARPSYDLEVGFPTLQVVSCRLRNITIFKDTGVLKFGTDGTMLLGDNSTGKSTVLKCIALAAIGLESANEVLDGTAPNYLRNGEKWGAIEVVFRLCFASRCDRGTLPLIAVGLRIDRDSDRFSALANSELTLRGRTEGKNSIERLSALRRLRDLSFGFTCAFGPERNFSSDPLAIEPEHSIRENDWVLSLFNKQTPLLNPETLMRLLRGDTRNFPRAPESLEPKLLEAIQAGMNSLIPNAEMAPTETVFDVRIRGEGVKLNSLSDGYGSIIAFVGHLIRAALRLVEWKQNPLLAPGILLIDELDVHLHPAWQAHVYGDLKRAFPNLQIISSTHSPLVAGALDASSVLLLETTEGNTSAVALHERLKETSSMKAWRADQILTGPGFNLPTSISIEAQEWEKEFEQLCSIPEGQLTPAQKAKLAELRITLGQEVPRSAESPITREAANLFEEWAMNRLKQRPSNEIAALVNEAKELLKFEEEESV